LYHWTHLELKRYFGISELLGPDTADRIFDETREILRSPEYSVRGLLKRMNVKVICTTDDPLDTLDNHRALAEEGYGLPVYPAFRPDAAMDLSDTTRFNGYVSRLAVATNRPIAHFADFVHALKERHDFFATMGCQVSDHGLEEIYADDYTDDDIERIFKAALNNDGVSHREHRQFKSAMLYLFAQWDAEKGWVQQYHLGALRNNNSRMMRQLGPDTGWDSIGDFSQGRALSTFLDRLDRNDQLAKTIVYNLNPADNEVMATMIGNFNDGSVPGKIQFGSAWWFLDQKDGMTKQINALSN